MTEARRPEVLPIGVNYPCRAHVARGLVGGDAKGEPAEMATGPRPAGRLSVLMNHISAIRRNENQLT
jgi:hypothetical protein